MAAELFKSVARPDIRHIPYKGVVAALPDLLGGRVTMTFSPIATGLPLVHEGKLRALAVTSLQRSSAAPELPMIAESSYPGFEFSNWIGLLAPARTPATIVSKLHMESVKALALLDLSTKLAHLGVEKIGSLPDEFTALIKSEIPRWVILVKSAVRMSSMTCIGYQIHPYSHMQIFLRLCVVAVPFWNQTFTQHLPLSF